ncbi:MAG: histidine triad nucleotide-binding protein [Oligoflexus sp.]|jgi:histidine triad (HIT) family protein
MGETIFDKILRKELKANIAYEDEAVLAFHDIAPQAPLHVLVIPKHKWMRFADLETADDGVVGRYMKSVAKVAAHLGLNEGGYRIVFNNGRDGGQTVDYIHAHILGGRGLSWPPG